MCYLNGYAELCHPSPWFPKAPWFEIQSNLAMVPLCRSQLCHHRSSLSCYAISRMTFPCYCCTIVRSDVEMAQSSSCYPLPLDLNTASLQWFLSGGTSRLLKCHHLPLKRSHALNRQRESAAAQGLFSCHLCDLLQGFILPTPW
eukprot:c18950_g1_i3 orf=326-757(-)